MGRQVNFYMLPEDLADFEAALTARGDMAFLAFRMPNAEPKVEAGLGPLPGDFGGRLLARPSDFDKLRIEHVPEQGDYAIRSAYSPVVEFSRCRLQEDSRQLGAGRMWYATRTWDGKMWIEPTTDFVKWADALLNLARRSKHYLLSRDPAHGGRYISRRAAQWRDAGGELVG